MDGLYLREYLPEIPDSSKNAVLFLHGYPGSQKNYDIAEHLALKGFHGWVMHYRGAWQSEGQYSLLSIYKDVELVLNAIQKSGYALDQISLIGASWGGYVALEILARNPNLYKVICLAPFINLAVDDEAIEQGAQFLYSITKPSIRNYDKNQIVADLKVISREFNPATKANTIDGTKVLIIHGENDTICPIEHTVKLKEAFKNPARLIRLPDQDHFLHTREVLFDFCYRFLTEFDE